MPKGYIIAHITVHDPETYKEYIRRDTPILAASGGRFIVRGGQSRVVEGDSQERHVVLEFPSYAAALAAWDDPEYQAVAEIRRASAEGSFVIVEGAE
ncbi:DUF1330 domain-containing protein [Marinovum sp. 2_MG-2023]|uniref:DUF1330 domain-containing protein n=1 Tax=unclassified Marinovum TaxID=2647166 RepID=UPI0026E26AC6|nr:MULTISPECIES: DUF1330 domain-containing protein [unclassified Marinovum]MDO6730293.1 DUF1330 domain-containing protein [Marinovum sp. 2_MG-2023]MDO6779031.1 DUF1330 domain-containing protein [Marinovum sp. 1_MG-2023]